MTNFNIEQENILIAKGTHFWCKGCLGAFSVDDQISEPYYCHGCNKLIAAEKAKRQEEVAVRWSETTNTFIIGHQNFGVNENLATTCQEIPPEKHEDENAPAENSPNPDDSALSGKNDVSKLPSGGIAPSPSPQAQELGVVMKHAGGRPRKTDDNVSRVTDWRRRKVYSKQGVLF